MNSKAFRLFYCFKPAVVGVFILCSSAILGACGSHESAKKENSKTYEVKASTIHKTLFFTGTIQPIKESTLTAPMEAVVTAMRVHFGQHVEKNEEIFTLNSAELQKQYNDTLTEYLKAKDSYTVGQAKFTGTKDLWRAGIISKNNFLSEKSSLTTTRVALMQAKRKLTDLIEKIGGSTSQDLSNLSFSEFDRVRKALNGKHNIIHLKSPSEGIVLYPPKRNDDKSARLGIGSSVKSGEVLALIGDLRGIRVDIDVPEIDIHKIKPGMPASIRGVAFGNQTLKGKLVAINAQASSNNGHALPSFTAIIEVRGLNTQQQSWIKVGMSATIELAVDSTEKLLIPIAALHQEHGKSMVKVRLPKGTLSLRPVVTGAAHGDQVVIDSGLAAGDVIVYE